MVSILLVSIITDAHAANFLGYSGGNIQNGQACFQQISTQCDGPFSSSAANTLGGGEAFQAPYSGSIVSVTIAAGTSPPNQFVIVSFPAGSTPTTGTIGPNCGLDGSSCGFIKASNTFTVNFVGAVSVPINTVSTFTLGTPVTVTNAQYVGVVWMNTTLTNNCGNCARAMTDCTQFCSTSIFILSMNFGVSNPQIGSTYSSCTNPCNGGLTSYGCIGGCITGITFVPSGQPSTSTTSCYGNCGTPAVTLGLTTSTDSIAFNQTLTIFYEFQSNVNGIVNNVTTSITKNYLNGEVITLGIYTIASCPQSQTPFSAQCPGYLATSPLQVTNPVKGKLTMTTSITVSNGQWVGISVSGLFSGLDLNDTNTNVQLFQTLQGNTPPVISQAGGSSCGLCKAGLWAYITGNVVTQPPPSPVIPQLGPCANNFAQIDCFLPALVNVFCSNLTTACQTTSALLWVPILALVLLVITMGIITSMMGPKISISFSEAMGVFTIFMLIVVFMMTSAGLLPLWVDIIIFMIVAIEFGDKVKGRLS